MSALFYGDVTDDEKDTASEIIYRNSLNNNSKIKDIRFFKDAKELEGVSL